MANWHFSVPSKTFLVGEYCVLRGGPSLLLATGPRFDMQASEKESYTSPFHTQSPAGRYFHEHRDELSKYDIQFQDPHDEKGGFGASSAQLLMLMVLRHGMRVPHPDDAQSQFTSRHGEALYKEYLDLSRRANSSASGADLMAQVAGHVVWFQRDPFQLMAHEWSFPELDFILIRTGFKIPTHWHIRDLGEFPIEVPSTLVREAQGALERGYQRDLVQSVREYRKWLRAQKFETERTTDLIQELEASGLVLTAKGCGAMGADVVLALSPIEQRQKIRNWCHDRRLQVVATRDELSPGLLGWKGSV